MTPSYYKRNTLAITNVMSKAGSMTFVMNSLAHRVKTEREALGLTQPELAKKAGVSQGSISLIEAGERYNITRNEPHHAMDDVVALASLLAQPYSEKQPYRGTIMKKLIESIEKG